MATTQRPPGGKIVPLTPRRTAKTAKTAKTATPNPRAPEPLPPPATALVAPPRRKRGRNLTAAERETARATLLQAFAEHANLTLACRLANIDRHVAYKWKATDPAFAAAFAEAEARADDRVRQAIYERAILGVEEPLHFQGRLVRDEETGQPVTVRKYSDTLLIFLAKSRMPEFRERTHASHEISGPGGEAITIRFDANTVIDALTTGPGDDSEGAEGL